jgi:hypothetical protein
MDDQRIDREGSGASELPKRRQLRFQLSVRTQLVITLLVAVYCRSLERLLRAFRNGGAGSYENL